MKSLLVIVVKMELFAGARSEEHQNDLERLLARAHVLGTFSVDYDTAAAIYRSCRRGGETPRSLIDCFHRLFDFCHSHSRRGGTFAC